MIVALMALLTGCRLDLAVDVVVESDGSGRLALAVTADAALVERADRAGADPLGRMAERIAALGGPWQVASSASADGARSVEIAAGYADPAEFALRWGELVAALDAPEAQLLGPLAITLTEETIAVDGALAAEVTELAAMDLGTDRGTLTEQLADAVSITVDVGLPAPLLSGSAPEVVVLSADPEGPIRLRWPLVAGETTAVDVVGERPQPSLLPLYLGAGIGGGATLLLIVGLVVDRRRRRG